MTAVPHLVPGPLPAGALRLADLGYWSLEAFAALAQHKVFWLSRLQMAVLLRMWPCGAEVSCCSTASNARSFLCWAGAFDPGQECLGRSMHHFAT